jgi:hypothetical protein
MENLSSGTGICPATHSLIVAASQEVVEMNAVHDFLLAGLKAVHDLNRHASVEDYIAAALPCMKHGPLGMETGDELEILGSEAALERFMTHYRMQPLVKRGWVGEMAVNEVFAAGDMGVAYVRDQSVIKRSPGCIRRAQARAERRGNVLVLRDRPAVSPKETHVSFSFDPKQLFIKEVVGALTDAPIKVSTYGFSGLSTPSYLPVISKSLEKAAHAA